MAPSTSAPSDYTQISNDEVDAEAMALARQSQDSAMMQRQHYRDQRILLRGTSTSTNVSARANTTGDSTGATLSNNTIEPARAPAPASAPPPLAPTVAPQPCVGNAARVPYTWLLCDHVRMAKGNPLLECSSSVEVLH